MKTFMLSVFMIFASLQISYASDSKDHDKTEAPTVRLIREFR